ncbi:hypothetical protein G7085_09100 [Tessaracoccus sp. HDW20]|nr:hypothetical protein [Tessaracoccus coleopterorum]
MQPGDELWDIAERELGSGERWREIVALNPAIGDSLKVTTGQSLRLPQGLSTPRSHGRCARGGAAGRLALGHRGAGPRRRRPMAGDPRAQPGHDRRSRRDRDRMGARAPGRAATRPG